MRFLTGIWAAVAFIALVDSAVAASVPQSMLGKSVVVSWTENRLQRKEGEADFRERSVGQTMRMYFSTQGRVFERRSVERGSRSGSLERLGGGAVARSGRTEFRGNSLLVAGAMRQGGARLINIEFSQDFSSCRAKVTVGRETGAELMKGRSLISKRAIEFKPLGTTSESCSIQNGNVFE